MKGKFNGSFFSSVKIQSNCTYEICDRWNCTFHYQDKIRNFLLFCSTVEYDYNSRKHKFMLNYIFNPQEGYVSFILAYILHHHHPPPGNLFFCNSRNTYGMWMKPCPSEQNLVANILKSKLFHHVTFSMRKVLIIKLDQNLQTRNYGEI